MTPSDTRAAALRAGTLAVALAAVVAAVRAARRRRRDWIAAGRYEHRVLTQTLDLPLDREHLYWLLREPPRAARLIDPQARVTLLDDVRSTWALPGAAPDGRPAGEPLTCTVEVIGDVPELLVAWSVPDGPLPHQGRVELQPLPTGSRVRIQLRYAWSPPLTKAAGLDEDAPRRMLDRAVAALRRESWRAADTPSGG